MGFATRGALWRGADTVCDPSEASEPRDGVLRGPVRSPSGGGCRVLIIEDNPDAADVLKAALELRGNVMEVAFDGPEGIEKARALEPDVVLCDIGLPGLGGYAVARSLRSEPRLRTTLLVALSGYAQSEDTERALKAGFDRHMAKPPALPALERMLAPRSPRPEPERT